MCVNGLSAISYQFILMKIKLNALYSVKKNLPELNMTYILTSIPSYRSYIDKMGF